MSMTTVAYARRAYKSFSHSARHIYQLIASHQSLQTGWAYVGYDCLADESSLTRRRVIQLVAFLEVHQALEVRRGHGRGHVNFYRLLREEDGEPVPVRAAKKVKSGGDEKVKFPTPPPGEKVKSETPNPPPLLSKVPSKIVETKEREKKEVPVAHASPKAEEASPFWCADCGYATPICAHRTIAAPSRRRDPWPQAAPERPSDEELQELLRGYHYRQTVLVETAQQDTGAGAPDAPETP